MNAFSVSIVRQRGVVAIEFALIFTLLFTLFYALVSYAIVITIVAALQHAASEGARSAIAVDKLAFTSLVAYETAGVTPQVKSTVASSLSWLPNKAKSKILGVDNAAVVVSFSGSAPTMTVSVAYNGYVSDPLLPILYFPGLGAIPLLPENLVGQAVVNL